MSSIYAVQHAEAEDPLAQAGIALFGVLEGALQQSCLELETQWGELVTLLHRLAEQLPPGSVAMDRLVTGLQFQDRHTQLLEDTIRAIGLYRMMLEEGDIAQAGSKADQLLGALRLNQLRHGFLHAIDATQHAPAMAAEPTVELF